MKHALLIVLGLVMASPSFGQALKNGEYEGPLGISNKSRGGCSSGFLADVVCKAGIIDPNTAHALDEAHSAIGRPIETQIIPGIADSVYPGAGEAIGTYPKFNNTGDLSSGGHFSSIPHVPAQVPNAQFQTQAMQPFQPLMGAFCATPAGRFGPGMPAPLGSICTAMTPYGPMQGQIN